MGVTLAIQLTSPVEPADLDLVNAIAMLLWAIAQNKTPAEGEEEEVPVEPPDLAADPLFSEPLPPTCGVVRASDGFVCVGPPHRGGRHLFRRITPTPPGMN